MIKEFALWSFLCSGVLVPGGFGVRGTEGKIQAIAWARKQKKPFLGKEFCCARFTLKKRMSEQKGIFWGKFSLFMYVCIGPCHGTNVEVGGQLAKVCFLLLSFVSQELGYQAWWQVPLPTEPSHWPLDSQYGKFKSCMQMTRNFEKVDCQVGNNYL